MGQKVHAQFGSKAMAAATEELPSVFPREMGPNALVYLKEVVESGLTSDMTERFERRFAEVHGVRYCMGTPGCTQAIFAAMLGMDFEPGDEIVTSPITDYGTVAGMLFQGFIPVFADTEPGTALVSARTIEPHITERTRAIMCVHKLGLPCDMDPILELAKRRNLVVIEDVCQAVLARYKGRIAGTLGHLSCYSFDSEKTLGGDIGGAVLTDDKELYDRIRYRAVSRGAHVRKGFGRVHDYQGFAIRMPQCTAATCLANLEILERQIENRQRMAAMLDGLIGRIDGVIPYRVPPERTHSYWMYGFSIDPGKFACTPAELASRIAEAGIPGVGLGEYYLMPAALEFLTQKARTGVYPFSTPPASRRMRYDAESVPNARAFLSTWVRWFWTEKYQEPHVHRMASIIADVAGRSRR